MEYDFEYDIDVEELVGFEFGTDIRQGGIEALLAVVQQEVLHTGNELADVAEDGGGAMLFGFPRALDEVLQTPAECGAAVATQLHDEYLQIQIIPTV